jgi:hypothetical protein
MRNCPCHNLGKVLLALLNGYVFQGKNSVPGFLRSTGLLRCKKTITNHQKSCCKSENPVVSPVRKTTLYHHETPLRPINQDINPFPEASLLRGKTTGTGFRIPTTKSDTNNGQKFPIFRQKYANLFTKYGSILILKF